MSRVADSLAGFSVRKATHEDRTVLLDLAARIFHQQTGEWLADRSWHRLSPEAFDPSGYFVAQEKGELIGVAAFRPFTLRLPGLALPWVGVGTVCTTAEARGRGVMSSMLRAGIAETDRQGALVSILWGDRVRYGRFGWEQAGRQVVMELSRRQFPDPGWPDGTVVEMLGQGRGTQVPKGLGKRLVRVQETFGDRMGRPDTEHLGLLSRPGLRTLWVERGNKEAYAVCRDGGGATTLLEVGGEPELLGDLIGYVLRGSAGRARAVWGLEMSPAERGVWERADRMQVEPTGMVRIHDVAGLLSAYKPWWNRRRRTGSGAVIFAIDDEVGNGQRVAVEWTPTSVHTTRLAPEEGPPGANVIMSDRRTLTRILFGPLPPEFELGEGDEGWRLRELFPLPLFVPLLERV